MDEKTKAESLTDILVIQLNSPDISSFDPRKAIRLWTTRTQSSAAHVGPDLDSSSISESQDERDEWCCLRDVGFVTDRNKTKEITFKSI